MSAYFVHRLFPQLKVNREMPRILFFFIPPFISKDERNSNYLPLVEFGKWNEIAFRSDQKSKKLGCSETEISYHVRHNAEEFLFSAYHIFVLKISCLRLYDYSSAVLERRENYKVIYNDMCGVYFSRNFILLEKNNKAFFIL